MDPVGPHVDVVHARQVPVGERPVVVLPGRTQPGDRRRRQPGPRAEDCSNAETKSPPDRPCRHSSGNTSAIPREIPSKSSAVTPRRAQASASSHTFLLESDL